MSKKYKLEPIRIGMRVPKLELPILLDDTKKAIPPSIALWIATS